MTGQRSGPPSGEAPISALIVRVDAAEPLVADLRRRFDPSAAEGAPPHVTILVPFLAPQAITAKVLARLRAAVARVPAFDFRLAAVVGRWPEAAFLVPEPSQPFVDLTRAVWAAFPDHPPYEGRHDTIVPHLTVAYGTTADAVSAERELAPRLAALGPVASRCSEMELIENGSGRWRPMHRIPLG